MFSLKTFNAFLDFFCFFFFWPCLRASAELCVLLSVEHCQKRFIRVSTRFIQVYIKYIQTYRIWACGGIYSYYSRHVTTNINKILKYSHHTHDDYDYESKNRQRIRIRIKNEVREREREGGGSPTITRN